VATEGRQRRGGGGGVKGEEWKLVSEVLVFVWIARAMI
jgi:hypothetical protein